MPYVRNVVSRFEVGDSVRPTKIASQRPCFDPGEKFLVKALDLGERPDFCLVTTEKISDDMVVDQLLRLEGESKVFPGITSKPIWASYFEIA